MKIKVFLLLALVFLPLISLVAQEHNHSHERNEIGISPGAIYSPSHRNWGFGIHAHYFRTLGEHSPWALGGSIEQVSAHGSHWSFSLGAKYQLFDRFNLAVMPGVTFINHDDDGHDHASHAIGDEHSNRAKFSIHFELVYDLIHWKHFHLGPAVDYSWSKHDAHFMFGVHCAYAF